MAVADHIPAALSQWTSYLSTLVILSSIMMVGCRRMQALVRLFAFQSLCLVMITLLTGIMTHSHHPYLVASITFVGKCCLIPWILTTMIRKVKMTSNVETSITLPTSILLAGGLTVISYYLVDFLKIRQVLLFPDFISIAMTLISIGFLIMVTHRKAFSQILGLYVMENGIYTLAIATIFEMPMIVEMGIFLDLIIGILVMVLWVYRINQTFDTVNIQELQKLKG